MKKPAQARRWMSVEEFLWKGSRRATAVQRLGISVFAACFLLIGSGAFFLASRQNFAFYCIIGLGCVFVGARLYIFGFS